MNGYGARPDPPPPETEPVRRRGRHWEVRDPAGELVAVTVYRVGAQEVARRLGYLDEHPRREGGR